MMRVTNQERRYHWFIDYPVSISLFQRRIPGVEIVGDHFRVHDAHVFRRHCH